ncbi:MAG: hypothetical protein RL291_1290 [Pseudomonadota bacterium]
MTKRTGTRDETATAAVPLRVRLDQAMAQRGLAQSRARARDAILRGFVEVNGRPVSSPSLMVAPGDVITTAAARWVSRGAEKLEAALEQFRIDPARRVALDVGASTGGFTEVLLQRGAVRVYAVDVGQGQLHPRLRDDPRVVSLEKTDARAIDAVLVPERAGIIVVDVSFIGLAKVLSAALARADVPADLVALVKPQFELGPERIGKGGIVRDAADRAVALKAAIAAIEEHPGWRVMGHIPSPVVGGDGNQEYLVWARLT